ncbi:MAG: 16S rRNA (uracil(1498)-N(3))-methyltransferase [Clostridia bacterium]|nr:16S rRNA (uracil(1498)-N(3))-methyltransferase [Clostridia bacterium]
MRRFFIDKSLKEGDRAILGGDEARHIVSVLRMGAGDELILINGSGEEMSARIESVSKDEVSFTVIGVSSCAAEPKNRVTLFQGLPKSDKLEFIIQKCVELGIYAVCPVQMKRSVVKGERNAAKLERYNRIAAEAAKQCGRAYAPRVFSAPSLEGCALSEFDLVLIAYEDEGEKSLKSVLTAQKAALPEGADIAIVIGPEGGFEPSEVEHLLGANKNAHSVSLGTRILRTETAGMALLAMLMYELEG